MFPERLPSRVREDRSRRAEVRLYDALASAPADWRVFHSVAWLSRDQSRDLRDGEADFVVVHPRHGLLIIEVKGGGIEVDGVSGQWWSVDQDGQQHAIHDPFAQAVRSKHALVSKLRELPAFRERWVPAAHAVAFPDLGRLTAPAGAHAPAELTICAGDLDDLPTHLEAIYQYSHPSSEASFDVGQAQEVERLLAPRLRVRAPLAVAAREADREILTLTEDQYRVLGMLTRLRRVAISGPAGSGKSLLAAEQARRLAAQGFRTLLVCFNRPLADMLSADLSSTERLSVHTFHDLCRSLGEEAGLVSGEWVQDASPEFFEGLPDLLFESLQARPDLRFDAIVVDEGQDFDAEWWALIELALADAELGILYVFHDDAQRLGAGESSLPTNLTPIDLDRNIRNTQSIHRLASTYSEGAVDADGPEGRPVEWVQVPDGGPLPATLSKVLHRLIQEEQFRPEEVAVLSGRGRASSGIVGLDRIGQFRCGPLPVMPGVVAVDTIRRFKGLDNRVVVLTEVDDVEDRHLLYVGMTRARTHLVVVASAATIERLGGHSA